MTSTKSGNRGNNGSKINAIEPFFSEKSKEKIRDLANKNILLVAADIDYALKYLNYIINYSKVFSRHEAMPSLLCLIFDSSSFDASYIKKYSQFCRTLEGLDGINVAEFFAFYFANSSLSEGFLKNERNLIVNYIKCARFTLVPKIWKLVGCDKVKMTIGRSNSLVYVIDYDFIANGNFDLAIRQNYFMHGGLLSCNIMGDVESFEKNLCKSYERVSRI